MDIISAVVGPIVEYTLKPIGRQLSYLFFIRQHIQNLESQVELLKNTKESVVNKVNEAIRNAEKIESGVQSWLTKVDSIIERSETLLNNLSEQGGLCLNLVQRHQLSRKAVKLAEEVVVIKNEGNFDKVSSPVALSEVESSKAKNSDFVDFESRKSTIDKIIGALMDDNVHTIGVYGMGGVGKTMLVQELSKLAMEQKLFDEVVTSTVSQTPDLRRIQGQLGDKLGLRFEQETEEGRALKLLNRLKMERQRILIVIDDVWKQIDLEKIGIPSIEDHNGCKILFTSRDNDVLFNDWRTYKNFEIKFLQEDETWNLFRKMAGEIVETSDFKSIAVEIARECAHLPIAITTIARALRNKPASIWKDALIQLRNPVVVNIRGMNEKVYSSLKLSYDYLDSEEAKSLFLLCSMFPEDYIIDCQVLHVYAMGMALLHGVESVAQARNRITKLVDDLISSSLLLKESNDDLVMYVKMHDIVRDVAIIIASKDDRIFTLSYSKGLLDESWDEKKLVGKHTAVCLNVKGLHNLPQKLMLPKVQLLVFCGTLLGEHELPGTFFEEMKGMRVLEIRRMKMPLLSPSLYSLTNLQSLHLFDCELENIDVICELNKLENLSLKGSHIIQIPATISQLTQLKVLDLSECYALKVIPPNILVNLTKLEELYLLNFNGWESQEMNQGRSNASISELSYLSQLCALALHIPNEEVMPKELFSRFFNLEKFEIFIGRKPVGLHKRKFSRVLCLKMETTNSMDKGINMLLKRSERLHLVGSIGARVFPFELIENESSYLKYLYINYNSDFQHFIHGQNKANLQKVLSNMERLELSYLENLESFFHGDIRDISFNNLKVIKLLRCNKLGSLFLDSNMNDMLLHLEKINITDCEKVKTIILMESGNPTDPVEFTNLKRLRLNGLPQLQSFYSKIEQLSPDQEAEKDDRSRNFNDGSLFNEQVSLPNLEDLNIEEAHNLKMIWCNVPIPNSFSKLTSVQIINCDSLEKVFSSSMMSRLTCLQSLYISCCKLLEEVFEGQGSCVTNKDIDLLSNLRRLDLIGLPKLQFICGKNDCEFLNFKSIPNVTIQDCPKLEAKYLLQVLDNMKCLTIDLRRLEEILNKEKSVLELDLSLETSKDGGELFGKLEFLDLCGSLSPDYKRITHLPMEIVSILPNIQRFTVVRTFLEEIFPMTRLGNVEEWQLSTLGLRGLPKLRHLWNVDLQKNSSMLQNLKYLSIKGCGILNMFVPSSTSFRNLVDLEVMECHKLTYLLNPSVARTMGQLTWLKIRGCKRMTSVIAKEENDEILFNKLNKLVVVDLPKLLNFHSGKCTIRFPVLRRISVKNCPEMKDFCTGIVSTPHLLTESIIHYDDATNIYIPILKDYSKEVIVKDMNVAIRQVWENHYDFNLHCLFEVENLKEENQCESSSHVEQLE